jgi:uncharacterized protein (DUF58 family)
MGKFFWFLLLILTGLAIFVGSAGDFVLTLLYMLVGALLLGRIWSTRALDRLQVKRNFVTHAFFGEQIPVQVKLSNAGWLPMVWLKLRESLPVELAPPDSLSQVISLGPRQATELSYMLDCRRRGYYSIGPLVLATSDVLGMVNRNRSLEPDYLTVFPRMVPISRILLESRSPMGTLRHHQPIFEDPSRVIGKRDYVAGDSLRRIDWKSTATTRKLQVKLFEPSISLATAIFLNANPQEYHWKTYHDDIELAITLAASLARHIIQLNQSVGLYSNGKDPFREEASICALPPKSGRSHLLRILETLARLQAEETTLLGDLLLQERVHLGWGTTVLVITNRVEDNLFDILFQLRRQGVDSQLLLCGPLTGSAEIQRKAQTFRFPMRQFFSENDLNAWQG